MSLISHILVALLYVSAFVFYIRSKKICTFLYAIAASIQLVLTGLCLHNETYIVCIAWSTVDLLLFGYIMLSHKTIKLPSLIIVQIIFAILWGCFFVITL